MPTSRRPVRLPVRIAARVWAEEVERFDPGSPARIAAEGERRALARQGLEVAQLLSCGQEGSSATSLTGLVKVYVPIGDRPPSERPYGFVFDPDRDERGPYLALLAYGERHPARRGARSVYERAHRRLHGRYPPP